ncbi:MFS transporter [Serratia plymuthica]|uniref:MFS transporter n=1 Tax=Serratia plymuthica TaxID=82996 RepID=A0A7T2SWM4_SERPL|nr:MFS transporter [Serratia plymuthica]QPS23029.1 MFS transporter [Serratia plymuthica]QPS64637.1 MFS transporter [Serratia plymuthica]RKS62929.1 DHA1 family inner membrane transport protein [Serratia plymuthica]UNK28078.1 MFS transporter [Serratia plymuthica]CAI2494324.1 Inner membrane transport protein ydhP [Serratia plymuthica]
MPLALLALAISAFAIGTTEFVTTGLLQDIARDLHITIPQAGYLTSGYALGVVISAPILTILLARFNRKHTLVFLILLFIAGSIVSARAVTFEELMFGRVLSAFCHGAFFGIGAVVATTVVAPNKKASAIALMFTGLTLANVVGVPLGTYVGQHFGWRAAFWAIAVLGVIGFAGLAALVPKQLAERSHIMDEIAVFKRPQVWLALVVTAIGFSGLLASFAYISPMMTEVAGFAPENLAWILSIYGVGLVVGNIVAAKFADRALVPTILTLLILLTLVLLLFTYTIHIKPLAIITVFLLGAIGFGTIPPLQMYVMEKATGAPTLASAANISAFNLGASGGVWLGGMAIDAGYGFVSPNWVGAMTTGIGLLIAIYAVRQKQELALENNC